MIRETVSLPIQTINSDFYDSKTENSQYIIAIKKFWNISTLYEKKITGAYVPVSTGYVNFILNDPDIEISVGPSQLNKLRYTNLICSTTYNTTWSSGKPPKSLGYAYNCGLKGDLVYPEYDSNKMINLFYDLFPNWVEETCHVYKTLPPYQCHYSEAPSVISSIGKYSKT